MFDCADGGGKTTQVALTEMDFIRHNITVYKTRSHRGTMMAELLRTVSLSDTPRTAVTDIFVCRAI
jgi:thymidylate kinase